MMGNYTYRQLVERIKNEVTPEEVAEKLGLNIVHRGNRKRVLCPFHDDHDPSLELFNDHYHCWACNAHGDVFELVKQLENLTFKEAVKWLAEFKGLSVPGYSIKHDKLKDEFKNGLEFGYNLYKKKAKVSTLKKWCDDRKIDFEIVRNSGVLSLNRNPLTKGLKDGLLTYSIDAWGALEDAGLVRLTRPVNYKEDGKTFLDLDSSPKDIFWYKSILFPIYNEYDRLQGIAARNNDNEYRKGPKYRFTKGFKRSENLYRIERVYEKARYYLDESKKKTGLSEPFRLFITEGFLDALRMESLGLNAVSILGNYLSGKVEETDSQLGKLKKLADMLHYIPMVIHLFLDNDTAGRRGIRSALDQIFKLRSGTDNSVFLNIILPGKSFRGKDPDELLKDVADREQAIELIKSWNRPVLDFILSYILDCHVDDLESKWEKLSPLQEAQLKRRIELTLPPKDKELCDNTSKWGKLYLGEEKGKKGPLLGGGKSTLSMSDFQKALSLAEKAYAGYDFPIDLGSWDRLKMAGNLLREEMNEHLKKGDLMEPCIPAFTSRKGGGNPRLMVLPCTEDLILQEYVLHKLLTFALKNKGTIPAVIHQGDLNNNRIITVGRKDLIPKNEQSVSFAYQVNASALRAGGSIQTKIFRNYWDCWKSFNNFILNRVSRSPQEVLFPARLDIRRFYDNIHQHAIGDVLKPALEEACRDEAINALVPGIDSTEITPENRATQIFDWICRQSFHYPFYSPENGDRLNWPDEVCGIPQGPNLSAWLANIILFPVDKKLSEEVDKINREYRSADPGLSEDDVVATYARYVDDVILLAPDSNTLEQLQQLFAFEINKKGLTLSPKTDPLDPQPVTQLREWLMENRGMGGRPSGPWEPSMLQSSNSLLRSIWVQMIDRKEALALLHDNDIDRGGFKKDEIKHILETVCQKSEEIRYRDYRLISKRLWQTVCDEFNKEDPLDKIIKKYKEEWDNLVKQPGEERHEDIREQSIIDNYRIPVDKTWPLHVCLEGIQSLLMYRMDRANFIDEECRKNHLERREKLAGWVLYGLLEHIIEGIGIENEYIKKFHFVLDLRKLTIMQIAGKITKKTILHDRADIKLNSESKSLNAIHRFSYRTLKPTIFERLRTYDRFEKLESILLFHEVIERLHSGDPEKDDPLKPVRESCEKFFEKKTKSFLAQTLFCLCPQDNPGLQNNDGDYNISQDSKYEAIQVFANCVTDRQQFTYLSKRPYLISGFIGEDSDHLFILPHPLGLPLKAIQVIKIFDSNKIEKKYLLFRSQDNEDLYDNEMLDDTLTGDISCEWKEVKNEYLDEIMCYYQDDKKYTLPMLSEENRNKNDEGKISILYHAFYDLINIPSIENYLITPFHIIEQNGKYSVFSPQYELSEEHKTLGCASINYANIESEKVPLENAYLWRLGVALSGLLNLFKEKSNLPQLKIVKDTLDSSDKNNFLSRSILLESLYILSGGKWWSKPKPYNNATKGNRELIPWAVENSLNILKQFMERPGFNERLALWLISRADSRLMRICCEKEFLHPNGGRAYILSILTTEIFYSNLFILQEFVLLSINDGDIDERYRRSVAWCIKGIDILEGLSQKIKNNEAAQAIRKIKAAFKVRAINNYFKSIALELKKMSQNSFESSFSSLQKDLIIIDPNNEVVLSEQQENNSDYIQFFRNLDRVLNKILLISSGLNSVTPSGWIFAAWTILCSIMQDKQKTKLIELSSYFIDIYNGISFINDNQGNNYPWFLDDKSMDNIIFAFERTFEGNNGFVLTKKIKELIYLDVKFCHSNRFSISQDNENISFSTKDSGNWTLKPWQFHNEILIGDDSRKYEREYDEGREVTYWTETWHKGELLGVSLLSESYSYLFKRGKETITPCSQDIEEEKKTEPHENDEEVKHETKEKPLVEEIKTGLKKSERDCGQEEIEEFKKYQGQLWDRRKHRYGRHIRVALCQWEVDESYSHPLKEFCELQNSDFLASLNKENITVAELKKNPSKYTEKFGLRINKEGQITRKLISCAEYRRRKILEEVFRVCKHFEVDLLLLPEYSIRPETVAWSKYQITNGKYKNIPLTVWCGTYRLPYWYDGRTVTSTNIPSMASPIHVIASNYSAVRWKKYPAVAFAEFFNPYLKNIEPLYKSKIGQNNEQRYSPGDFVLELICSENFALTSPVNRNAVLQAYYQLERIWGRGGTYDFNRIKKVLDKDLEILSRWSSLSPSLEDKENSFWLKYSPRRTIFFVPAMSSRSVDYHLFGQANLLAAGICTVFCNAVGGIGKGGSCFIGHGSWTGKHNSSAYYDDRFGPYNGVFPGIYRRDQGNDGALGCTDQALVIADIDPVYMTEGKPRQQMLQHPLQLVAHLPIIEIPPHQTCDIRKSKVKCACNREKIGNKINETLEKFLEIKKYFETKRNIHHPKTEIADFLEKLSKMSGKFKDLWLEERAVAYKNNSMVKPSELPPPAIYDWLPVFSDISDDRNDHEKQQSLIEIPPFTVDKDSINP
jgi:hypothetical protein